ncbi:zinc ABC transporter, integral membrane protein (plasmid) [Aliarcobacter faecis]|uniref:Zinc ABC transporter, integral membrane protein n=1 Tax=Aliarcobacter faecis TaxID=1564138 RepID=A0A6M8N3C1_9BACT|nr:metal ABC transporter permease [Aliarcobacter faecis]QKF74462.1 zinc ABC transporter, integral membrane protein [Aliarcobacter faecis]
MEIFQYEFMINAFIAGVLIAILTSTLSLFVVVKRYAMLSDALAHISLLGVAIGFLFQVSTILTAIIISIIASIMIEYLRSYKKLYSDSMLSIFLSSALAMSVIIVSLSNSFNSSLFDYLFGSIVAVTSEDIFIISLFFILTILFMLVYYQKLLLISFNEELAISSGINVRLINLLFTALIGTLVAISIKIIGALLIGAIMIIPVVSAICLRQGFRITWILSTLFAIIGVVIGLVFSFYVSIPSGATIVIVLLLIFLLTLIFSKRSR